jgi:hypothetical protein
MKHIVSYSGGIGSAITADLVIKEYGKENVILLFADTFMEDEDLYRFNTDIQSLFGIKITKIADGRTPWEVFRDESYIGNTRVDPCSRILKRTLLSRWVKNRFSSTEVVVHVGIDYSEKHRIERLAEVMKPYKYMAILVEKEIMLRPSDKIKWCKENNIDPPRLYTMGFPHNNCGGFCVKAGLGQFKMLYEKLPERYMEHENEMESLMLENNNLKPFLRKNIKKVKTYLTLKQYRELYLETGKADDDTYDIGGCGCAL